MVLGTTYTRAHCSSAQLLVDNAGPWCSLPAAHPRGRKCLLPSSAAQATQQSPASKRTVHHCAPNEASPAPEHGPHLQQFWLQPQQPRGLAGQDSEPVILVARRLALSITDRRELHVHDLVGAVHGRHPKSPPLSISNVPNANESYRHQAFARFKASPFMTVLLQRLS